MAERDIFEKYDNLREDEPNAKSNKNVDVKSDVMNTVIKPCRGEKKRGKRKIEGVRKTLMILMRIDENLKFQCVKNTKSNLK